jgi:hypothetical protein
MESQTSECSSLLQHVHRWRIQGGGTAITNSEPGMIFKVCGCGVCEHITPDEAAQILVVE